MTTSNSDLKKFAVFVNSKTALVSTTTKSDVTIPFTANLAHHDPLKVMKFSIVDALFSNIFYNIRPGVQTLKYLDVFAPGRNIAGYTSAIKTVTIPAGFYSYDSLTSYLNTELTSTTGPLGNVTTPTFTGTANVIDIFNGFGSTYSSQITNDIAASNYSLVAGKIFAQSPSLGDMWQNCKLDNTVTATGNSGIYAGKYLVDDEETYPLLHLLGYSFVDVIAPVIPNTTYRGWGFPIYSKQVGSTTQYSFDGVIYGTSTADISTKSIIPFAISDLTGLDDLYIHCSQLRTQYMSGISKYPLAPSDVIAVIPINVPFGDKMSFVPNFPLESFLINTNVTQLTFRMTNSNNELVNFQGLDWAMTIFCEEVPDSSRIEAENSAGNMNTPYRLGSDVSAGGYMESRVRTAKRMNNSV